ncbi:MAG: hydroxyisourate hydrolase [Sphingomonadaceae bacterium]
MKTCHFSLPRLSAALTLTLALAAGTAGTACAAAAAAAPALRADISLATANRLLDAALESCHADGKTLAAAVVDRSGNLVALRRDDNVGPHNTLAAQRKAYTALSTKTATRQLAAQASANPQAQNLNTVPELLLLGGGVPLLSGTEVIGAIGVAGAGGADNDEACALQAIALAPVNPLSVHVLNQSDGLPAPGVEVTLEQQQGERWIQLNRAVTNAQGRISGLFPARAELTPGSYRVTFRTGAWYAAQGKASFFPEIPVIFRADGSVPHYHVPLLLSQYGYSTYRGN